VLGRAFVDPNPAWTVPGSDVTCLADPSATATYAATGGGSVALGCAPPPAEMPYTITTVPPTTIAEDSPPVSLPACAIIDNTGGSAPALRLSVSAGQGVVKMIVAGVPTTPSILTSPSTTAESGGACLRASLFGFILLFFCIWSDWLFFDRHPKSAHTLNNPF
jgi:hypothetical protein